MNHRLNPHPILWPKNTQDTLSSWKKKIPAPSQHIKPALCGAPKKTRFKAYAGTRKSHASRTPFFPLMSNYGHKMKWKFLIVWWSKARWAMRNSWIASHRTAWWLGVPIVVGNQSRGVFNVWVQTKLWLSHDYFILVFPSCYWCKSPWCS